MGRPRYQDVGLGLDTVEVNSYGELTEGMEVLLDAYQQIAIEERDSRQGKQRCKEVRVETAWDLCGQPLMMAPHGVGQGQYQYYMVCPAGVFRVATSNMNDISVKVPTKGERKATTTRRTAAPIIIIIPHRYHHCHHHYHALFLYHCFFFNK